MQKKRVYGQPKINTGKASQDIFPEQWKRANVMPLYKGKGERSNASSYRPISLCSCIGKLLEKIVKEQVQQQIAAVRPLSSLQHGFGASRSTLTNLLTCDSLIANLVNAHKSYDIITFDFQRIFDKVPHHLLLEALKGQQLKWIASFLSGRTQQVIFNGSFKYFRSHIRSCARL